MTTRSMPKVEVYNVKLNDKSDLHFCRNNYFVTVFIVSEGVSV